MQILMIHLYHKLLNFTKQTRQSTNKLLGNGQRNMLNDYHDVNESFIYINFKSENDIGYGDE